MIETMELAPIELYPEEHTVDGRPPHVTPEEAVFLAERGPYVGRLRGVETLLRFAAENPEVSPETIHRLEAERTVHRRRLSAFERKDPRRMKEQATADEEQMAEVVTLTRSPKRAAKTLSEKLEWQVKGACNNSTDKDVFYAERGDKNRKALTSAAKKVCATCVVRPDCLRYAIQNDERFGVWGGMTARERGRLKKKINERRQQKSA